MVQTKGRQNWGFSNLQTENTSRMLETIQIFGPVNGIVATLDLLCLEMKVDKYLWGIFWLLCFASEILDPESALPRTEHT